VAGLTPGQRYLATVWSFDDGSAPVRTSDWFANGRQVVDDYQFDGGAVPPAPPGNQTYAFAFYTEADGAGELTISGVAQPGTQPALFLDALTLDVVDPPKLLQIDFNDRSSAGPFSTQPGFYEFLLSGSGTTDSTTQTFGSTRVTVTASGAGTALDDRRRGAPVNSGDFDQQEALRDFIFANNAGIEDEGMDILIEGLEPDVEYGVTIWSFDDLSSPTRTSDWYVNGQLVLDDYAFNGDDVPPSPSDNGVYSFTFYSVADSNGELLISAVAEPGTQPAIFLNALAIQAAVPEPATIVLMVLGALLVVPAAAHRRGRIL